jgi:hypothetical protein
MGLILYFSNLSKQSQVKHGGEDQAGEDTRYQEFCTVYRFNPMDAPAALILSRAFFFFNT